MIEINSSIKENEMKINMTNELSGRAEVLRKVGQSDQELFEQVFKLGLYQLEYRRENNETKAAKNKLMREVYKRAQADPELSVKLGLGTRPSL
jgi:hypothetical protein